MDCSKKYMLSLLILTLGLGGGIATAGYFVEQAIIQAKATDRYVTVKGLSQRQVKADLGIWEIDYREVGNNLTDVTARLDQDQQTVISFLTKNGFTTDELEIRPAKVNDLLANPYNNPPDQAKDNRYIVTGGIRIRSTKVDQIQRSSQLTSELIRNGVPLSFDTSDYATDLSPNPSYLFTQLDAIRPDMMAEATKSARLVAEQFAKDSNSQLGGIRRASQGVFQITSRDASDASDGNNGGGAMSEANAIYKKIRLVTTIDYYLKQD